MTDQVGGSPRTSVQRATKNLHNGEVLRCGHFRSFNVSEIATSRIESP